MTDAEGFFRFSQLGPGPRRLDVRAPGYAAEQLTVEPESGIEVPLARAAP